jgi:hypothetical protein
VLDGGAFAAEARLDQARAETFVRRRSNRRSAAFFPGEMDFAGAWGRSRQPSRGRCRSTMRDTLPHWLPAHCDLNEGAERLFGYTAADVVGKPVTLLIPHAREGEVRRAGTWL